MGKAIPAVDTLTLPTDQDASGRSLGTEELAFLEEVVRSGTLTSTKGSFVSRLEGALTERFGVAHAIACSSGTSAVHAAIAAVDPEPGEEIIVTPITDMGALTPVLYQGAIPVFADVDPDTLNMNPASIRERITDRTRAIVVTHLFGLPAEVQEIQAIAREAGIPLMEDCAQAYLASVDGKPVGAIGEIGAFSMQQGKHMTTGEGGFVLTSDASLGRRMRLWVNKAWGYGDPDPDHYFLALNSRLTELQGAVALAQLGKLEEGVSRRIDMAGRLGQRLADLPGVGTPSVPSDAVHTFWRYHLRIDPEIVPGGPSAVADKLKNAGLASAPRYIGKPAFQCAIFSEQRTFGSSRYPFTLAHPDAVDYSPELFPGAFSGLAQALVLPWNERYEPVHVDFLADRIIDAVDQLRGGGSPS